MKEVAVLIGSGSIGQAIARRIGAGKHVVLGDLKISAAEDAAGISPSQASVEKILQVDVRHGGFAGRVWKNNSFSQF